MAGNTGDGYRKGAVRDRVQVQDKDGHWVKINTNTDEVITITTDFTPYKGVAKDKDNRRKDD